MKRKSTLTLLLLFMQLCFTYAQQINTDNTLTPQQLIQNLVGNDCASANNVSSSINGAINSIISYGSFNKGNSNFPLENGIILSTGSVTSAGNAYNGANLSEGEINWLTDSDIENILGIDQTLNATSIEFDFSSANNFVSFKYLFASDEYQQDFPCNFKDVFAILIKRADTTDPYVNIALIPDTTSEISTNAIHPEISEFCAAENEDFFDGYNNNTTNFNGHTTVLTATSPLIPNEIYHIKFVIADHIDERFDSAVFIDAEGFGSSIDLGPDQSVCGNDILLNAAIDNSTASYSWFFNGTSITGEDNSTLDVYQSGTYTVEILIPSPSGNCIITDSIDIEIIPFQAAAPITDLSVCDASPSDGFYEFDFPLLKNDEILADLPSANYTISYHLSAIDAQNNINPIAGLYQNTEETETIYVRIESLSGDCIQQGSFNIAVNTSPNTLEIDPISVCDGFINDGGFPIDEFNIFDFAVANYEFNRTVSYHLNESDAINNENVITSTTELVGEPLYIYARVNDNYSNCFSTVKVNFDYQDSPDLGINKYIVDACFDPNYYATNGPAVINYLNAFVPFNIDDAISEIEEMFPGAEVRILTFLGLGGPPRIYSTSQPVSSIPLGISFNDTYCETEISLELHKNLLFNIMGDEVIKEQCDDHSNDGIYDFDLIEIIDEIKNGYDINILLYETEEDLQEEANAVNLSTPYTVINSDELFIAASYNECTYTSKIIFNIIDSPVLIPQSATTCGDYNNSDDTTTIIMQQFNHLMYQGIPALGIEYFLTENDAILGVNSLGETYAISGNTQTFYVKVVNQNTGCADITTLDITINDGIELNQPSSLIACDENLDGFETVNLENVIPELINNPEDYVITFHTKPTSAILGTNAITNPTTYYTESDTIYIRVSLPDSDCFAIISFEVVVVNDPQIGIISDYINCETTPNSVSEFIFENKDFEVVNGQYGMQVLYFVTEEDAINRINSIDKSNAYINITNPQTIYVRLENEAENSCYKIAPMQLEVRQAPIYTIPTDVYECDINSTGLATTNLANKVTEINTGSTTDNEISFHLTPLNAAIGTNAIPLNFTATTNPQLIYVRVKNVISGCVDTPSFLVNTLSLPEVNYGLSLVECGNNYDFIAQWNLTTIELDIIEGRQYGIDFTYFETESDLIADTNAISNPETFTNTSNPQTIYLRVRNTITGCFSSVPFDILLNTPPVINDFETYNICDNASSSVNLQDINELLLDNTFNVLVSYHSTPDDAETNQNPLNPEYNYTNTVDTLYARVEFSTTNCYTVYPFTLNVNPLPIANPPNEIVTCDDDFDGYIAINLALQNNAILNGQNPDNFSVSYYNTESNAYENINPLNLQHLVFNGETVFARIENTATGCFDVTQFSIVINPLPLVNIEDQVICLNDLPLIVSANTDNPLDSYLWSTNVTSPEIEITETGEYSVTVTNQNGCEYTSTFNVTESESANINVIEKLDFSDPNNITVSIVGIGDYLYSLNGGPPQLSNTFYNVPIGYNTITIFDNNGCAQVTKDVLVIDTPKHFTPNGDGDFDSWHITGVETLPGTIIKIFSRQGKLLTVLDSNSLGWDGNYNGNKMPTGDYWYVATVKKDGKTFEVSGHFSLRR